MLEKTRRLALVALAFLPLQARAADPALPSRESVLVLRNDFVLRGRVTPLGDHYLVTQANSDQVRMPAFRVEMVCASLEEAYLRKRDRVVSGDVRSHLDLSDWCLRHGLQSRAADQLLAAIALDPGHPRIPSLQQRLLLKSQPPEESKTAEAPTLPQADASDRIEPVGDTRPTELSVEAIQQFTTEVQPLLMNSCASGACHGPNSNSDLVLLRPPVGQLINSRLTQKNLHAVLRLIDRQNPLASPLLSVPQQPHGGLGRSMFAGSGLPQYETLRNWLRRLKTSGRTRPVFHRGVDPAALLDRVRADGMPAAATAAPTAEAASPPSESTALPTSEDPFDPARFNGRQD